MRWQQLVSRGALHLKFTHFRNVLVHTLLHSVHMVLHNSSISSQKSSSITSSFCLSSSLNNSVYGHICDSSSPLDYMSQRPQNECSVNEQQGRYFHKEDHCLSACLFVWLSANQRNKWGRISVHFQEMVFIVQGAGFFFSFWWILWYLLSQVLF